MNIQESFMEGRDFVTEAMEEQIREVVSEIMTDGEVEPSEDHMAVALISFNAGMTFQRRRGTRITLTEEQIDRFSHMAADLLLEKLENR